MKLNEKIDRYNIVSSFNLTNPKYDFGAYARGYHHSAKLLSEKFLAQSGYRDYEGYPIVFLYRHSFELNLKNIIYWGVRLSNFKNEILDIKLHNTHNLIELAKISSKILFKIFPDDMELHEFCNTFIRIAKEFTDLDKDSYSYRYPIDVKGNCSTDKHQVVNITSLSKCMGEIQSSMEAINFGLDIETSNYEEIFEMLDNYSKN